MSRPALSVLFPVRDGMPFLPEAIDSIARQTFEDFEVIAVDDGSTDESPDVLDAWADRDARVRVIEGGTPGRPIGIPRALERARALARGSLLARMDADDVTPLDRFTRQTELLTRDPRVALCGIGVRYEPRAGLTGGGRAYERWINGLQGPEAIERDLFVECPIAHPTFMMRAGAVNRIGGYRDEGAPEDYDLVLRLWEAGVRFDKAPGDPHVWRDHERRASRRSPRYAIAAFQALKVEVLLRSHLRGARPCVVWGAGPTGKAFARLLRAGGGGSVTFVDLDPRKIGQRVHGSPVIAPDALGAPDGRFALASVAGETAREEIRAALTLRGWRETDDFVAVA